MKINLVLHGHISSEYRTLEMIWINSLSLSLHVIGWEIGSDYSIMKIYVKHLRLCGAGVEKVFEQCHSQFLRNVHLILEICAVCRFGPFKFPR